MNEDHGANLRDYCRAFGNAPHATAAIMTGIDRYGFEMTASEPDGSRPIRLAFERPIATPGEARRDLVALAKRAREALGGG